MNSTTSRNSKQTRTINALKKRQWVGGIAASLLICFLIVTTYINWKKVDNLSEAVGSNLDIISNYEQELAILRTFNPHRSEVNDLIDLAVQNDDILPGWIARVYHLPSSITSINEKNDLGSFVMNGAQFNLGSHKMHGIQQPSKSMYRLNGLLPTQFPGRHQLGVEFNFLYDDNDVRNNVKKVGLCFVQVHIQNNIVINERVVMSSRTETSKLVTGELELGRGVFPIDAVIYCDEKSDFYSRNVEVSFSFRNPHQHRLTKNNDVVHYIHQPQANESSLLSSR